MTNQELKNAAYDSLVLAAPTVDISNLDTSGNTEDLKEKVIRSCKNMFEVAHRSLSKYPQMKNVTIMEHGPRFDEVEVDPEGIKPKLASFANSYFLQLWMESPHKNKIFVGQHTLSCNVEVRKLRYTDTRTGRHDGVHMYGRDGKAAYTQSVLNILLSSISSQPQPQENSDHLTCPQTVFKKKNANNGKTGQYNVKVSNRFSSLINHQGNF